MKRSWRGRIWAPACLMAGSLLLASCQAFAGADPLATIEADMTQFAAESQAIRASATAERGLARATIAAASTKVSELSAINAALGATLRASYTGTPEVRAVVVSAADMGSSLDGGVMDDAPPTNESDAMLVTNLATASGLDENSGCSSGAVSQFSPTSERIYVTARVTALQSGATFSVDWLRQGQTLYSLSWQADYAKAFECIWFYVTPEDFAFLPGDYAARLYVDGVELGSASFSISGA